MIMVKVQIILDDFTSFLSYQKGPRVFSSIHTQEGLFCIYKNNKPSVDWKACNNLVISLEGLVETTQHHDITCG